MGTRDICEKKQGPLISAARASISTLFKTQKQKTSLRCPRFVTNV